MESVMPSRMTAEELFAYPESPGVWQYELVQGTPIAVYGHGWLHATMAGNIHRYLYEHVQSCDLGVVMIGGIGYILARDPDTVRIPDGSFIPRAQLEEARRVPGFLTVVPELVVEVVSPTKPAGNLKRRVEDFIVAGVRVVLVAWSSENRLSVYTGSMTPVELTAEDTLDGGDVLPEFSVPVADLFDIEW